MVGTPCVPHVLRPLTYQFRMGCGVAGSTNVTDRAAIAGWGFKPMQTPSALCNEAHHSTDVMIRESFL
jgi:hypothetical protein